MSAGGGGGGGYDARVWQPHVLAHLPLYGVLVPLAAEAAAARVRARGPEPAATLLKVRKSESYKCWLRWSADGSAVGQPVVGHRSGCSSADLSITDRSLVSASQSCSVSHSQHAVCTLSAQPLAVYMPQETRSADF